MKNQLSIIIQTYQRTDYATRTVRAACLHLIHDGPTNWIVADDGSKPGHVEMILAEIALHCPGGSVEVSSGRRSYGRTANEAAALADKKGPVSLWLEDDWELRRDLYLTPYVDLLNGHGSLGMVRLGHLPVGLDAQSVGFDGRMYLEILNTRQYMFSGNPHLKHARFMDHYGPYPTDRNPGDTEIEYDSLVRKGGNGPRIVWPLSIGDNPLFAHIGEVKSYG
jgi:hypothetical protein